jgi:hypothetical protein
MSNRSQTEKFWIGGGLLGIVVLALLAWFLVVSPELSSADSLRAQTDDANTLNLKLRGEVDDLVQQNKQLGAIHKQLDAAHAALPNANSLDTFTEQLTREAAQYGVKLTSVVATAPTLASGAQPAPAPSSTPSAGSQPDTDSGASNTGNAATNPAGQLFAIPVTVVSEGSALRQQAFLHAIQTGPRSALVTSTALGSSTDANSSATVTTMTVQLQIFVAPLAPTTSGQSGK